MKPWMPFQIQSVTSWEDLRRFCAQGFQNIYQLMNGKVGFTDNIYCQIVDVSFPIGGSSIPHNFERVPLGFLVLNKDADVNLWSPSSIPWTSSTIYIQTNNVVNAKIAILGG